MANVHCAAATEKCLVLEFHGGDMLAEWEAMVIKTDGKPLMEKGYGLVPLTAPGLGIELNDENLKSVCRKMPNILMLHLNGTIRVVLMTNCGFKNQII